MLYDAGSRKCGEEDMQLWFEFDHDKHTLGTTPVSICSCPDNCNNSTTAVHFPTCAKYCCSQLAGLKDNNKECI